MPVTIRKLPNGKYRVSTPNMVHAKATTLENAKKQRAIINAADAGHPIDMRKRMKELHKTGALRTK